MEEMLIAAGEEIAGLTAALRVFVDEDKDAESLNYRRQMEFVVDQIAEVPGVRAVVEHDYDHYIPHAIIYFTSRWMGPDRETIREILMAGSASLCRRHSGRIPAFRSTR